MPYYRKLTTEEQAYVDKRMRKCHVVVISLVGIVVFLCVILFNFKEYL